MKKLILLFVALGAALFAQPTMVQTTLSATIDGTQGEVFLASGTGVTAGMYGYVDRELFKVNSISGTTARVSRGVGGKLTGHTSGIAVYFGQGNYFTAQDPAGRCTAATTPAVPFINYSNGAQWGCSSGTWTQTNTGSGGDGGTSLGTLTGVIKATAGSPDVVAGDAADFVKVDGSSGKPLGSLSGVIKSASGVPAVVSGVASDCVYVDGTSGTCGSGSGASISGTDAQVVVKNGANGVTRVLQGYTNDGTNLTPDGTKLVEIAADQAITGEKDFRNGAIRLPDVLFANLPTASSNDGRVYRVTDGASSACAAGGGSTKCYVYSDGTSWTALGGGSSSSTSNKLLFIKFNGSAETLDNTDKVLNSATYSLPASTLGNGKCLYVRSLFTKNAVADSVTFKLNYGAANVTRTFTTSGATARVDGMFCYDGAGTTVTSMATADQVGGTASLGQLNTTATVDPTTTQTVSFTANGPGTSTVQLRAFTVEVIR